MRLNTLIAFATATCCITAGAQDYPNRPITFVVPVSAGGGSDAVARAMAQVMSARMKQAIIVDNKPGASGMLGAQTVARANPNGYTVLVTNATAIYYAPHMFASVPYDVQRDFAFITEIASASLIYAVAKDVPARNIKEFVSWASQNKGKVNYGSYGVGSISHLVNAYLNADKKLEMNHIPYKGEAQMVQDMLGGAIPVGIGTAGVLAPHIASGKLRALAVLGPKRLQELPGVPTIAESGFPGPEYTPVGGMMMLAPAATPAPVLALLEKEARAAVQTMQVKARLQVYGLVGMGNSSAEFRRNVETSAPAIQKLVNVSGAKTE